MSERAFRFGVIAETHRDRRQWLNLGCTAESLGYDTLMIRDHLAPDYFGPQFAPLSALAVLAGATDRLRLGTLVIDNDFRHPTVLAKEAATLDVLSEGRFELGIGAGWLRNEYDNAGLTYDRNGVRVDRLEESLQILKACFNSDTVSYAGDHYRLSGHQQFPAPVTIGGPPILIGAGQPRMLRLAGKYADIVSLLTVSVSSGEMTEDVSARRTAAVRDRIALIAEGAGSRFPEIEINLIPDIHISDDPAATYQNLISARNWLDATPEDVADMPAVFVGSIDQICERMIERRADLGISCYVIPDRQMREFAPIVARLAGA